MRRLPLTQKWDMTSADSKEGKNRAIQNKKASVNSQFMICVLNLLSLINAKEQ